MAKTLYMVVEHFKNRDAVPIYRRLRDHGRMMPDGLNYLSSWITTDFDICYQLMEADDPKLFEQWMANWNDLMEFEIHPVATSKEVIEKIAPRL